MDILHEQSSGIRTHDLPTEAFYIWSGLMFFSNHIDPIQLIRPTFYRKKGRFYSSAKREILRLNMNELKHNGEKIADEWKQFLLKGERKENFCWLFFFLITN